jgi:peptidoglycan/LPS O-acetylase OafA/YrhL
MRGGGPGALPSSGRRLPGIEGLRAVAALSILVLHTWAYSSPEKLGAHGVAGTVIPNLGLGVILFFALSGFLLYRPFAAAIARAGTLPEIGSYARNRALRILPAYWVILLISALVLDGTLVRDSEANLLAAELSDPAELLGAALLIQNYGPATLGIGIGPAWSLAVEVVFYLLLPLLVLGAFSIARRVRSRSQRTVVLLGPPLLLLAVGITGKLVAGVILPGAPDAGFEADWHSVVERSFLGQADLFAFGMVAAVLHTEVVDGRITLPAHWRPAALVAAIAIVAVCAKTFDHGQLSYKPQNTAVALAAALLVAAVAFPSASRRTPRLTRLLETRVFVIAGLISYSVFLWHEPVVRWLAAHDVMREGWDGLVLNIGVMLVVVGALSYVTYRLVELPALRRKRRMRREDVTREKAALDAAQLEAAP